MRKKILIIGGGVIGLTIGRALLQAGHQVAILEQGRLGEGATRAAVGMICPWQEAPQIHGPLDEELMQACHQSRDAWAGFAQSVQAESGIDIDYRPYGSIALGYHELVRSEITKKKSGSSQEVLKLFDGGMYEIENGALLQDEAQVDPVKLVAALAAIVKQLGGEICEQTKVSSITHDGVVLEEKKNLAADEIIITAGLHSNHLWLENAAPPLLPVKGQALTVKTADLFATDMPLIRTPEVYICPKADGITFIGATQEPYEDTLETDQVSIDDLHNRAANVMPALANAQILTTWAGLRPTTPDLAPILGRSAVQDNVFYATGHFRHGVLLAPITGELILSLVEGQIDETAFTATRFR
jgi:glycine oxidase